MSLINGPIEVKPKEEKKPNKTDAMKAGLKGAAMKQGSSLLNTLTGIRFEPSPTYLFYVELSGIIVGEFTGCSGIGIRREEEMVREGGLSDFQHSLPGAVSYEHIVLKKGLSVSQELWKWFQSGLYDYKVKRLNISIIQGAAGMNMIAVPPGSGGPGVIKRWNVERAYPVSWRLSDLSVDDISTVAIETLELAHEGVSLSSIAGTPMSVTSMAGG
jgi:phage tail-like protein